MKSALWILTIVNLLNYLDRYIIASASPKIESEFGLSHGQTGFIMSAFMVGYMITSPLFGWIADRYNRPRLMGIGVFLWSIATAMTGWVNNYIPLVLSRIGVGVGEASYATISPSYIRDRLQDERKLNRAISIFYTAIPLGAAMGYIWGGYMTEHYSWRWAFYLGALPGLILGFAVWFLKETDRPKIEATDGIVNLKKTAKLLWENREYRLTVLGYTAHTFGLGGFAFWAPHYCSKTLGVGLSEASFKIGAVTCVAGLIGTLIGGKWGDIFIKSQERNSIDSVRGFNKFSSLASLIATPFAFWMLFASSANEFIIALLLVQIGMFASLSPINTATLAAVPAKIAATAFAVQILIIHILGDVLSPPLVGWLADQMPMNKAMAVLAVAVGISAIVWWITSLAPRISPEKVT